MSYNLSVSQKFTPDRPLLPWRRKLRDFNTKLAKIKDRNVYDASNRYYKNCTI